MYLENKKTYNLGRIDANIKFEAAWYQKIVLYIKYNIYMANS